MSHHENQTKSNMIVGDSCRILKSLEPETYQTCITSPPYFQLRDYDHPDQIGQERTVEEYVEKLLCVFDEVRRVIKNDGTCWVNIADGFDKNKSLRCIPFLFAMGMKQRGWIFRQDIIWSKPNVAPESTTDRCVRSHEYIFMFVKQERYKFYTDRIREKGSSKSFGTPPKSNGKTAIKASKTGLGEARLRMREEYAQHGFVTRNKRSVWEVSSDQSKIKHDATYPVELILPMILASTDEGERVLDPFGGSGTTGVAAVSLKRACDMIEINAEYAEVAQQRIAKVSKSDATLSLLFDAPQNKETDTIQAVPYSIGSRIKTKRQNDNLSQTSLAKKNRRKQKRDNQYGK